MREKEKRRNQKTTTITLTTLYRNFSKSNYTGGTKIHAHDRGVGNQRRLTVLVASDVMMFVMVPNDPHLIDESDDGPFTQSNIGVITSRSGSGDGSRSNEEKGY